MTEAILNQIKIELQNKIGMEKVLDNKEILDHFSSDESIEQKKTPDLVVTPTTIEEIQEILNLANKYKVNIIPSSSTEKYYGATIPKNGGIIVDLRKMNKIIDIDFEERYCRIEAGVTFKQLQTELKKHGLRVMVPLGLPSSASVVSTYIERVPLLTGPKILLSEGWQCTLNMQIVIPNGMIVNTGSASWCKDRPSFLPSGPLSGLDLSRLFSGAQGTLGIVTDLVIKAKYLPKIKNIIFISYEKIEEILDIIYKIQFFDKGREFLGISQKNLAMMLSNGQENIEKFRKELPPWIIVMSIEADSEEKYQIDLEDLKDIGVQFQTEFKINGNDLSEIFLKEFEVPDKLNNFRKYKGTCLHIPFYINLDKIKNLNDLTERILKKHEYPIEDLYGYLMPIEQAHTCYYDFNIHYNRNDSIESEQMMKLFLELSELVIENGGIIDRPYGSWAKMIFSRNEAYYNFLRQVKNIIDPNDIMNPSQLRI